MNPDLAQQRERIRARTQRKTVEAKRFPTRRAMNFYGKKPVTVEALEDAELRYRMIELQYRMIECAIDPDHPASRANRSRWTREFAALKNVAARRGLLDTDADRL
jgi:hypothetical protein